MADLVNNKVCSHYLADCKICTFAENILKCAFYICSMKNAYNPTWKHDHYIT